MQLRAFQADINGSVGRGHDLCAANNTRPLAGIASTVFHRSSASAPNGAMICGVISSRPTRTAESRATVTSCQSVMYVAALFSAK